MAEKVLNRIERRNALQSGSTDHRSQSGVGLSAPSGAETANDLAMHDGWSQVSLTEVIGWADICAVQEDE